MALSQEWPSENDTLRLVHSPHFRPDDVQIHVPGKHALVTSAVEIVDGRVRPTNTRLAHVVTTLSVTRAHGCRRKRDEHLHERLGKSFNRQGDLPTVIELLGSLHCTPVAILQLPRAFAET